MFNISLIDKLMITFSLNPHKTIMNKIDKLDVEIDEKTWKEVQKYKIDNDIPNNNETVIELIKRALKVK